jgi:Uma2 family endonuclease
LSSAVGVVLEKSKLGRMATAPTLPFVSVEEYLKTDYEPHCEYLDGVLLAKSMADVIHSALQMLLIVFLAAQREKFKNLKSLPELNVRVTPTRFRIPDVCGLIEPPKDGRYPDAEAPPLFTIEIVSQDEPWIEVRAKVADHLAMGVSIVVIADPYNKTVTVATQSEPLHEIRFPQIVKIPVPDAGVLEIDFDHLYRQI